jgi:hypothetical protein
MLFTSVAETRIDSQKTELETSAKEPISIAIKIKPSGFFIAFPYCMGGLNLMMFTQKNKNKKRLKANV